MIRYYQNITPCPLHLHLCYTLTMGWGDGWQVMVVIKGCVQGVFFRDWTVENTRELGLHGWVNNCHYGSIEALFSGDPAKVQEVVDCRCRVPNPLPAAATNAAIVASVQTPASCSPPMMMTLVQMATSTAPMPKKFMYNSLQMGLSWTCTHGTK